MDTSSHNYRPRTVEDVFTTKTTSYRLPSEQSIRHVTVLSRFNPLAHNDNILSNMSEPYDISYRRNKTSPEYEVTDELPKDQEPTIVNVIDHYKIPKTSQKRAFAQALNDKLNMLESQNLAVDENNISMVLENLKRSISSHKNAMRQFVEFSDKYNPERTPVLQMISDHYTKLSDKIPEICDGYQSKLKEISVELDDSKSDHESLRNEKESLEVAIEKLNRSIFNLKQQIEDHRAKCASAEAHLRDSTNEKMAIIRFSQSNKEKLNQLTQQISEKEDQLAETRPMIDVLTQNLESNSNKIKEITEEVARLDQALQDCEVENVKLDEMERKTTDKRNSLEVHGETSKEEITHRTQLVQVNILQQLAKQARKLQEEQERNIKMARQGRINSTREAFMQNKSDLAVLQEKMGEKLVIKNLEDLMKARDIILQNNQSFNWSSQSIANARTGNFALKSIADDEAKLFSSYFISNVIKNSVKCIKRSENSTQTESTYEDKRKQMNSRLTSRKPSNKSSSRQSPIKANKSGKSSDKLSTQRLNPSARDKINKVNSIEAFEAKKNQNHAEIVIEEDFEMNDEEEEGLDFIFDNSNNQATMLYRNARLAKLLDPAYSRRRPKGVDWLIHSIRQIYDEKVIDDQTEVLPLDKYILKWAFRQYGRDDLIQKGCWDLLISAYFHMQKSLEVMIFVRFLDEVWTVDQLSFFLKARSWCVCRCVTIAMQNESVGEYLTETFMTKDQVEEFFRKFCPDTEPELVVELNIRCQNCADRNRGGDDAANIPMYRVLEIAVGEKEDKKIRSLRKMLALYRLVPRLNEKRFSSFVKGMIPNIDANTIDSLFHSSQAQNSYRKDIETTKFEEKFKIMEDDKTEVDFSQYSQQYSLSMNRWSHFQPFLLKVIDQITATQTEQSRMLVNEIRHNMFLTIEAKVSYDGELFYECYHKLLQVVLFICMKNNLPDALAVHRQISDVENRIQKTYDVSQQTKDDD
ncbi:hypothetical protein TVAG_453780 [Trichomonas vaginalis G3]|uniref:Uncharacterized protein n=1 Tax=Trichomonas vaginalis (strain ATCC PRA-98 / G3) TaxID=412133 RepID=A2DPV4_TRIV3|nr:hypothetical protein TVAGG3_0552230 [Trichomonas vaginalis G3]EAY17550.1 hypothetical protein TVAG_453780 [Trichomonas vaginalis G3]KAI5520594.1 hypothetical protein TVAGG3_0552230 [Trichomonas vaginalis G3]|eukprot:XP_001329685.1 hypothetical protein [Trichomonas vaginalis G3]